MAPRMIDTVMIWTSSLIKHQLGDTYSVPSLYTAVSWGYYIYFIFLYFWLIVTSLRRDLLHKTGMSCDGKHGNN